jgi:hypothetical protein
MNLTGDNGIIKSGVLDTTFAVEQSAEWARAYGYDTIQINATEEGYSGTLDLGGSYVAGINTINLGLGNILTGYAFLQSGEGVFGTGIKNKSGDHFSFITGIGNDTSKSYCNFTTGRSNTISFANYSLLAGVSSTISDSTCSAIFTTTSEVTRSFSSVLLGRGYKVNTITTSILGVSGSIVENIKSTVFSKVIRSIILGAGGRYDENLTDSVAIFNQGTTGTMGNLSRSFVAISSSAINRKIEDSVLVGVGVKADTTALDGSSFMSKMSVAVANDSMVSKLYGSLASIYSSTIIDASYSALIGSKLSVSNSERILMLSNGSEGTDTVSNSNISVFLTSDGTTISRTSQSVILSNGGNFSGVTRSVIAGNGTVTYATLSNLLVQDGTVTISNNSFASVIGSTISSLKHSMLFANKLTIAEADAGSSISGISRSFVNIEASTITNLANSVVIASKINATKLTDSLIIIKGSGNSSDLDLIDQSIIIGDIPSNASSTEVNHVQDSIVIGDDHKIDSMEGSILVGDNLESKASNYVYLFGKNNKAWNVQYSQVIGRANTINGNTGTVDGIKGVAYVLGESNTISVTPDTTNAAEYIKDIYSFGSNNEIVGKIDRLQVFGSNNKVTSSSLRTDGLTIMGRNNTITASDSPKSSDYNHFESLYVIGDSNSVTYFEDAAGEPSIHVFGSHIITSVDKTSTTQYYGFFNDTAIPSKVNTAFMCKWKYHKGEISMIWGIGTPKKRFNGMYLGRDGDCYGNFVAHLYVAGDVTAERDVYAGSTKLSGADYAEYFETVDNKSIDDMRFVTSVGDKITETSLATDYVVGVTSTNPGTIGNYKSIYAKSEHHHDRDHEHEHNAPVAKVVGLMGQIMVQDNGECQVDEFCQAGPNGLAYPHTRPNVQHWRVLKRISSDVILILFR